MMILKLHWCLIVFGVLMSSRMNLAADSPTPHASIRYVEPMKSSGMSLATVVRGKALVHTSQIQPSGEAIKPGGKNPIQRQCDSVIEQLESALRSGGTTLENAVKLNVYVVDENDEEVSNYVSKRFQGRSGPAISYVRTPLLMNEARLAMDAIAVTETSPKYVERWRQSGAANPDASHGASMIGVAGGAILPIGPRIYIAGQAEKGDGSLADATRQTMAGLMKTLKHLGLAGRDVVHVKAFVTPMKESSIAIQQIMAAFPEGIPAPISIVEWKSTLPIEIEMIAAVPPEAVAAENRETDAPSLEFITPPWMTSSPVYARVVRVNHPSTIFLSGLYGTTDTPNGEDEVRGLLREVERLTTLAGGDLKHLVKATYYVTNDEVSNRLNVIRPEFYSPERPPSASKALVQGTGRVGRTITLDMIATPVRDLTSGK